jgi:hypothetical protein
LRVVAMSATVLRFPVFAIRVERADDAWLVICREHGWLYGSRSEATADAIWLAANHGAPILDRSVAGRP